MSHPFFFLGFALLLVHEMDAIRLGEWRIFPPAPKSAGRDGVRGVYGPARSDLRAPAGGLFGGGGASSALIVGMDVFFVVHVAFHVLCRNHLERGFGTAFSWGLIARTGACGLVDLVLLAQI